MKNRKFSQHYQEQALISASPEEVFAYLDDHTRLASHMSESSWMMGGGRMETSIDDGKGQKIGSHIQMSGRAFGIALSLDEVITRYEPPHAKEWETVGNPQLLVVGHYRMGIALTPHDGSSDLQVFIHYNLPKRNVWLGRLFGKAYAKWCVRQMLYDIRNHFS